MCHNLLNHDSDHCFLFLINSVQTMLLWKYFYMYLLYLCKYTFSFFLTAVENTFDSFLYIYFIK